MNRRQFLAAALSAPALTLSCTRATPDKITPLTHGPRHHFFGYYGICPWDLDEKRLLCLETAFQDHMPEPGETATIGLVDGESGHFTPVAETSAWNFQQGAMLHWHPLNPNSEIIHNDLRDGQLVSVVRNINTGQERLLPRPLSGLGHNSPWAVSLTYGRVGRLRNVVSYAGTRDPYADDPHPEQDGVFAVNIDTGETRLITSIRQVYEHLRSRDADLGDDHIWFNHTVINRNDTRLLFLARTRRPEGGLETGMFTVGMDGTDLREVIPYGWSVSHFDWRNDIQIIATGRMNGEGNRTHLLLTDGENDIREISPDYLGFDGHCTFSPDGRWIATDRRHGQTTESELLRYHVDNGTHQSLGRVYMHDRKFLSGDLRCDLHPRWSRSGKALCIDALDHEGTRQLHIINV